MRRKIFAFIAGVAFVGFFSGKVSAATHVVQKGDSLWSISQNYGTSVQQLKALNNLNGDLIYPNQALHISAEEKTESQDQIYKVVKGDSLWKISNKYGVSVADLKAWNNLASDIIHPGQSLAVKKGAAAAPEPKQAVQQNNPAPQPPAANSSPVQKEAQPAAKPAPVQKEAQPAAKPAPVQKEAQPASSGNEASGRELTVTATAYTAHCNGCSGVTATGIDLRANPGLKVIAVDPSVIPLGSKVHVEGYGTAVAGDTGGAIKGNKIDIFMPDKSAATQFGRKTVKIKVLN